MDGEPRPSSLISTMISTRRRVQAGNSRCGLISDQARIRLQFTSPTKPALITGSTGNGDEPVPDYRYLVVPLRTLAGA